MKYIFFGTADFATFILEKLIAADMSPVAVVTNPDKPAGRKKVVTAPPVKTCIAKRKAHIMVMQPENLLTICDSLFALRPDAGILAAYGKIIPQEIIDVFPKGIVVAHPSLLPHYRGSTPIQSAILNGDIETGTTLFLMDKKIDHGKILAKRKVQIADNDTYLTLMKKLAAASANLLIETLPSYMRGDIIPQAQDETQASYTKKYTSEDGYIDLKKNAPEKIWRMVRALNPEPGVFTLSSSKGGLPHRMKILEADIVDGKLVLRKIQFDGEKPRKA